MPTSRRPWWVLAGLVTGGAGLATSYAAALLLTVRRSPVVSAAEWVIGVLPGWATRWGVESLGRLDKPVLVLVILGVLAVAFAWCGLLARRHLLLAYAGFVAVAAAGTAVVAARPGFSLLDLVPLLIGLATWVGVLPLLTRPLRGTPEAGEDPEEAAAESRRAFLVRSAVVVGGAALFGVAGRMAGAGRRTVEATRRMLRLEGVTAPRGRPRARLPVDGISPWRTPQDDFYLVDTVVAVPTIRLETWQLRIHGLVDRNLTLSYHDLISRKVTQAWMTLSCVSNPVGGDLVGNAWWSGVRVADLLAEVGVAPGADAVLQTSQDGWTCVTPIEALTDDRDALLAVAMNGQPLPVEHGFPVRMVVPGLYGYVSATKWLVDLEVTRFADVEGFWTSQGWAERAPVKVASRIDVPRDGATVPAGDVEVGGVAWFQHTGIDAVQVSVDDGDWQGATLAVEPSVDAWVQWRATMALAPGEHLLQVRARGRDGEWQTGRVAEPFPDGATGWHGVTVTAES